MSPNVHDSTSELKEPVKREESSTCAEESPTSRSQKRGGVIIEYMV